MGGMVGSEYQKLAEQIMAEQSSGPDIESFIAQRINDWQNDDTGSEVGFDEDTLKMFEEQFGADAVEQLSAKQAMELLLRGAPSDDLTAQFEGLSLEQKRKFLEDIINSDGLGSAENMGMPTTRGETVTPKNDWHPARAAHEQHNKK